MVHYYESFPEDLREWALQQKVFFTASAPLRGTHVNVSPKGLLDATFHIFDPNHAAYMDSAGTGIETISHVYENKRITLMFCSLDEKPRIMRLFCTGSVIERTDPKFPGVIESMGKKEFPGIRAVIMLDILKVQTSCGYGVPLLERVNHSQHLGERSENCKCYKDRPTLEKMLGTIVKKGKLDPFLQESNARSIDGLLGLREARKMRGEWLFAHDVGAWMRRQFLQGPAIALGILIGFLLFAYGTAIMNYIVDLTSKISRMTARVG
ncbi:hypothetical protein H0G86_012058 [Trichoderma simmonsii]|uniref:Pyridoxamine phosphate oxidase family protein n=1 Tax=Trichoderma simmonsii TaxID=1491479 RepID=A0A8G0LNB9_9HYPO|nr:hypothetical protein H0G86_012058 [Trichoderma simmonsii]